MVLALKSSPYVAEKLGLLSRFVSSGRVLDYGCGTGSKSRRLAELGLTVWGIDCNPERIDQAIKASNERCHYVVTDPSAKSLPFDTAFFDCVFASEIIEHLPDLASFIREVKRVLRKDGILFLTTPNGVSYRHVAKNLIWGKRRLRVIESWPQYMPRQEGHLYYWDLWTLYRLMHINGFTYLAHEYSESHNGFRILSEVIPFLRRLRTGLTLVLRHSEPEKRHL